ncbi:MAG: LPS assembly lipoprotein LptE [Prevotellaceae bacterium]|jgi:hypothetical protein|nr:LPS assembly lipoprotein LptE [Prevotellaceae bacterium]
MKKNQIKSIYFSLFLFASVMLTSCGIYSFTGASYGAAKSVSIDYFQNIAPIVVPTLSNTFTEALKDKFIKQTPLTLVTKDADMSFEGEIREYSVTSIAVTAQEIASQNRLIIKVHVKFVNKLDDKWSFDKEFSAYDDFNSAQSLSTVQDGLIKTIVDKLIEDIFNASVANW